MTKVELLEKTARTLFESDSKMISTNEYNTLIANAARKRKRTSIRKFITICWEKSSKK